MWRRHKDHSPLAIPWEEGKGEVRVGHEIHRSLLSYKNNFDTLLGIRHWGYESEQDTVPSLMVLHSVRGDRK